MDIACTKAEPETYLSATRNGLPVFKYTEFTSNGDRPAFKCSSTPGVVAIDSTRVPGMDTRRLPNYYFLVSTAARYRSSDSTSAGSATVSAISWRKSSR